MSSALQRRRLRPRVVVQLIQLEKTKLGFRPGSAYPKASAVSGLLNEVHGAATGRSGALQGAKLLGFPLPPGPEPNILTGVL